MLMGIKEAINKVNSTVDELTVRVTVTDAKINTVTETLVGHLDRISSLEIRQLEILCYLRKAKPCTEMKIVCVPADLVCGEDLSRSCCSILIAS
ncbi:hypothetical protein TKK_0013301 [Trichogramma kaykai]